MSITKSTNKKTGITYVFESHSYWDKEKKAPRNTKKIIGKIDPKTGQMVPTRKRKRNSSESSEKHNTKYQAFYEEALSEIKQKDEEIRHLKQEISTLLREHEEYLKKTAGELRDRSAKIGTAARKFSV